MPLFIVKLDETLFSDEEWRRQMRIERCGKYYIFNSCINPRIGLKFELHAINAWVDGPIEDRLRQGAIDALNDSIHDEPSMWIDCAKVITPTSEYISPPQDIDIAPPLSIKGRNKLIEYLRVDHGGFESWH